MKIPLPPRLQKRPADKGKKPRISPPAHTIPNTPRPPLTFANGRGDQTRPVSQPRCPQQQKEYAMLFPHSHCLRPAHQVQESRPAGRPPAPALTGPPIKFWPSLVGGSGACFRRFADAV